MDVRDDAIELALLADPKLGDHLPLASFSAALRDWTLLLRQETSVRSTARPAVEWTIGSPASHGAVVEADARPLTEEAPAVEGAVLRVIADGLERIERGEKPDDVFDPTSARLASSLIAVLRDGVSAIRIRAGSRTVLLTRDGAGRQAVSARRWESFGSIRGEVRSITFDHRPPYFVVATPDGGGNVPCYFEPTEHLDAVRAALLQPVVVVGTLTRDEAGAIVAVSDISEIRLHRPPASRPRVRDLVGIDPDLTDGLPSEEWVRRQRVR